MPAFIWQVRVLWPEPLDAPPSCPNLPLPKDSFSMTLSAGTLIPAAVILGVPQSPQQLTYPLGFLSPFSQCKMANSGGACIALSTTANRKDPMTQNPNCLSLGSNPSSPTSRLQTLTRNNPPEPWFAHLQNGDDIPRPLGGLPSRAHPLLPRTHPQGLLRASTCYMPSPMHGKQPPAMCSNP